MRPALALLSAVVLAAQSPQFGVESRLVLVPVTVTDAKGRTVEDLEPADFTLLDEGRRQEFVVDTFATGVAPIALVVAVQSSGISAPVLAKVRKVGAMIQAYVTGDRGCAALVGFAREVRWLQDCTASAEEFSRAFDRLEPRDDREASMLDAVQLATERLRARPNSRRVLLLVSQSRDRGSSARLESAIMDAEAAGVTVYAATYSAFKTAFTAKPSETAPPKPAAPYPKPPPEGAPSPSRNPDPAPNWNVGLAGLEELVRLGKVKTAQVLAERTGGATFSFSRLQGLENAIAKLGGELHTQYLLSFTPDGPAPGYHQLEVRVRGGRKLRVRARPGYWSRATPAGVQVNAVSRADCGRKR